MHGKTVTMLNVPPSSSPLRMTIGGAPLIPQRRRVPISGFDGLSRRGRGDIGVPVLVVAFPGRRRRRPIVQRFQPATAARSSRSAAIPGGGAAFRPQRQSHPGQRPYAMIGFLSASGLLLSGLSGVG